MKKFVKVILCVSAVILVCTGCSWNKDNQSDPVTGGDTNKPKAIIGGDESSVPVNKEYSMTDVLEAVEGENTYLTDKQMNEKINFGEYAKLQKSAISNITEDNIQEVWLVKLEDIEKQSVDIATLFFGRLEALRNEYKDNEKLSEILNGDSNQIIYQAGGIAVLIISKDASTINDLIQKEFSKARNNINTTGNIETEGEIVDGNVVDDSGLELYDPSVVQMIQNGEATVVPQ